MADTSRVCIVVFAFGTGDIRPNRLLGRLAFVEAKNKHASWVYTQADVSVKEYVPVVRIAEEPGNPPPTLRIARGAVVWAKDNGVRTIIFLAAKPHLERAKRDLEFAAKETGVDVRIMASEWLRVYPFSYEGVWYSPESTQKRTQSRKKWQRRERILKWIPMCLYKRIAS